MHSTDVTLILEQKLLLNSLEFQIPDHPKREGPTNYTMFENHQEMSQGKNYYLIIEINKFYILNLCLIGLIQFEKF